MQAFELLRDLPLVRHGLIAGVAVATLCSLLSVVVVLKRLSFMGQGISHAGFGGAGLAVLFGLAGVSRDLFILAFCLATAVIIALMSRRKKMEPDSAIGIMLGGTMALGVFADELKRKLLLAQSPWYLKLVGANYDQTSYESLLFGSILSVPYDHMLLATGLCAAMTLALALLSKEILFYAFDETAAQVAGVRTGLVQAALLAILAAAVVVAMRLVGVVLASALLVVPGAAALELSRRLAPVLIWSWILGVGGVVLGMLLSLQLGDFSTGPCITGVLCVEYLAARAAGKLLAR